jgi:hypothetical protein
MMADFVADMQMHREAIPVPIAECHYSGKVRVRIPPNSTGAWR